MQILKKLAVKYKNIAFANKEKSTAIHENNLSKRNFLSRFGVLLLGGAVIQSQANENKSTVSANTSTDMLSGFAVKNISSSEYSTKKEDAGKVLVFSHKQPIRVLLQDLPEGAVGFFEQGSEGQVELISGNLQIRHVADQTKIAGKYGRVYYRVTNSEIIISGDLA